MKRTLSLLLVLILTIALLSSCSNKEIVSPAPPSSETATKSDDVPFSDNTASPDGVTPSASQENAEDASSFECEYNSELDGVVITKYIGTNPAVTIPSTIEGTPVVMIGDEAFSSLDFIVSVFIPNGVTSIGDSAFMGCQSLAYVGITGKVTSIGKSAFDGCESLHTINLSDGLTRIEEETFYDCKSLASIKIPSSVTSIGEGAFAFCEALTSITIPSGVTSIEDSAFYACEALTSVAIPDSVTSIGESAFRYCESLSKESMEKIRQINPEALS